MNLRPVVSVIGIALLLFASTGGVTAQGEGPGGAAAPQGTGAAFTYQGRLESGGGGVSGDCDFQFGLWESSSGGAQVGVTQTVSALPVSAGLFTARVNNGNEFGNGAFDSDNRYLAIAVRCPAGSGGYTDLAPRQEILVTPYAQFALAAPWWGLTDVPAGFADGVDDVGSGSFWTLTGNAGTTNNNFLGTTDNMTLTLMVSGTTALRLVPTGGAPNVLGGALSNSATAGIFGAAVGGGQDNTVNGSDAAIAGGFQNTAGYRGAVGGGSNNTASASWTTVSGGRENTANAEAASVGGGYANTASGSYAALGGGNLNLASGSYAAVGGGYSNTASSTYAALGGGYNNNVSALYATAGGGRDNRVAAIFGTVGGGNGQFLTGYAATIGGGEFNSAAGNYATVGGGDRNAASGANATVAGGVLGTASGQSATVGGGNGNTATNNYATVGGGDRNAASGLYATIGGGILSTASAAYTTVGGGYVNYASANWTTVSGGRDNIASGQSSTVAGGWDNTASGAGATVGGGGWNGTTIDGNTASGVASTIGGGWGNVIFSAAGYATIGGGDSNIITGTATYATVAGGRLNTADHWYTTVAGGLSNVAGGDFAGALSGYDNTASGHAALIAGGTSNTAGGTHAVIGGGNGNTIFTTVDFATVGGGSGNLITGTASYGTVGGGNTNFADGQGSTVAGGESNVAGNLYSAVGGGYDNSAAGAYATVPGGLGNHADANYAFAAGRNANADHQGSFVWADSTGASLDTTATNQFLVRASGGVTMYTDAGATAGAALFPGASSWTVVSDRNAKNNFAPVDGVAILNALAGIPIETWNYNTQAESIRHMGPMAQDFYAAFGLGETALGISTVDADGVALAAIQGLYSVVQEQQAENAALQERVAALEADVETAHRGVATGGYGQLLVGLLLGAGIGVGAFALGRRGQKPLPRITTN